MQIAWKYNLVFNSQKKTRVKAQSCQFLWLPLQCQWCPPRPGKGQCHIWLTSTNECITKLQEFLGLVTYLSPFIPGLSTLTAPLHVSCSRRPQTSSGTAPMMLLFSRSKKLSSVTPPSGISTPHSL